MSARHDWNTWDQYQAIHTRVVEYDYAHFIVQDQLAPSPTAEVVQWYGVLYCQDGLELHVRKRQEVRYQVGRPQVRTVEYSYHALRRVGGQTINLFRYDNIHVQPGHDDAHHRHRFDEHGAEIEPPEHVGTARWPTLGDVLRELHEWWEPAGTGEKRH